MSMQQQLDGNGLESREGMSTRFPAAASSKEARENVGSRPAWPGSPSPVAVLSFSPTLLDSQARATAAGV